MKDDKFVAYYRVSTQKQGASGLGLEGQRFSVAAHIANAGGELVGEFEEVETGGGANALTKRPGLAAALALCKKEKATLVIAKLDRLARNIHFVSGLLESKVSFIACDMPLADKTMIQIYAVMSEWERDACKARTKAAWHANAARKILNGEAVPSKGGRGVTSELSVSGFAERIGKSKGYLTEVTQAATVFRKLFAQANSFNASNRTKHLTAIHAAPSPAWLILASLLQSNDWSVKDTKAAVDRVKEVSASIPAWFTASIALEKAAMSQLNNLVPSGVPVASGSGCGVGSGRTGIDGLIRRRVFLFLPGIAYLLRKAMIVPVLP